MNINHCALLLLVLLLSLFSLSSATRTLYRALSACPNGCSGQGVCMNATATSAAGECSCFPGFHGVDCSIRLCPSGIAWVDFPYKNNTAHWNYTECSNMGVCDRSTGLCQCRYGYGGAACDMMLCPMGNQKTCFDGDLGKACGHKSVCSGNGRCLPLRDAATWQDFNTLYDSTDYTDWDADKIYGCVCEEGWEGPACDRRICPKGDNPSTTGQHDEIQLLDCKCNTCQGGIYITFRGKTTDLIPYDSNEVVVRKYLEALDVMEVFVVKIREGKFLCPNSGATMQLTVKVPSGPQADMIITTGGGFRGDTKLYTNGRSSRFYTWLQSTRSTKEYVTCSGSGDCDHDTGMCKCFPTYFSSDGMGNAGLRGDCGRRINPYEVYQVDGTVTNTTCPYAQGQICGIHGSCVTYSDGSQKCECDAGYVGVACDRTDCPNVYSWFGDVGALHSTMAPCAGVGICNETDGTCYDCGGDLGLYSGDNCEYLSCYEDADGNVCGGNGRCLTMRDIGSMTWGYQEATTSYEYTTQWDADMIKGCTCERADPYKLEFSSYYSEFGETYDLGTADAYYYFNETYDKSLKTFANYTVVNRVFSEKFYRGPYGNAVTDFTGYHCQSARCPAGDDPHSSGEPEIQALVCRATNGTFTLSFRGAKSASIAWNSTVATLKSRIETIPKIRTVDVWMADYSSIDLAYLTVCTEDASRTIYIEFQTEHGDVPLLEVDSSELTLSEVHQVNMVNVTEYVTGTTESFECSARGLCDEFTGICRCLDGYQSSNGTVGFPGHSGDCSYFAEFYNMPNRHDES